MNKIKFYRKQRGFTQRELADKIGVTQGVVSHWEIGLKEPRIAHVRKLSEVLRVSIDELLKEGFECN